MFYKCRCRDNCRAIFHSRADKGVLIHLRDSRRKLHLNWLRVLDTTERSPVDHRIPLWSALIASLRSDRVFRLSPHGYMGNSALDFSSLSRDNKAE
jgi:hypothetical protein